MDQSILSAGSAELAKVRDMLAEYQGLRASVEEVRAEKAKADQQLQAAERALEDSISTTLKKRRTDLESGFNREIQKEQNALKKVRNAREKAKSRKVAGRIAEETSELREKNRTLHAAIRTVFKQKGLPGFCDTKLYYALFMPGRISEICLLVVCAVVFLGLLPAVGAYLMHELWQRILVFAVVWLVVIGLYLLVSRCTKGKNRAVLVDMKDSRREILRNEKEIRRIRKAILADKSEDLYGLEKYDLEIRGHEDAINQLTERKNIVMLDFETNTKKVITDEITAQGEEQIAQLRETCDSLRDRLADLTGRVKELSADLASDYEAYLGREYMDTNRLQALIDIIDSGQASTVKEAMDVWRAQEIAKEAERIGGENDAGSPAAAASGGQGAAGGAPDSGSEVPDLTGEIPNLTGEIPDLE